MLTWHRLCSSRSSIRRRSSGSASVRGSSAPIPPPVRRPPWRLPSYAVAAEPGAAQQNQEWFVPNQTPAACRRHARPARPAGARCEPAARRAAVPGSGARGRPHAEGQQQLQVQLPPPPEVPPLPKGPTPPAAIVGVLSVPDVMRASTAFQQADKEFLARRQKLNEDAQKEQVTLRDLGQQLANERSQALAGADPHAREGPAGPHHRIAPQLRRAQPHHPGSQPVRHGADRPRGGDGDPAGGDQPRHQHGAEPRPDSRNHQRFRPDAAGRR